MGDSTVQSEARKTVLVTGFGPFTGHSVNASWQAVKELHKMGLGRDDYQLVIKEIPVAYKAVKEQIPDLWRNLKPFLVVHVGVSHLAHEITLEQIAHNDGYSKIDVDGKMNDSLLCCPSGPIILRSDIPMDEVCDYINKGESGVMAVVSTDPGRYLCDYIYYSSLHIDGKRTAFIHVPKLGEPYSAKETALGIKMAIHGMLIHLEKCDA